MCLELLLSLFFHKKQKQKKLAAWRRRKDAKTQRLRVSKFLCVSESLRLCVFNFLTRFLRAGRMIVENGKLIFSFQISIFNSKKSVVFSFWAFRYASGFPLYLFPLRSKRMPLQSLTQRATSNEPRALGKNTHNSQHIFNSQQTTDFGYAVSCRDVTLWRLIKNKVLKGRQFLGRRWSAKHGTPAKMNYTKIRVPKVRQNILAKMQRNAKLRSLILSKCRTQIPYT